MVEQWFPKPPVGGSSPSAPAPGSISTPARIPAGPPPDAQTRRRKPAGAFEARPARRRTGLAKDERWVVGVGTKYLYDGLVNAACDAKTADTAPVKVTTKKA